MEARTYQLTGWLRIADNISTIGRFNDEKVWTEFFLTRAFPSVTWEEKLPRFIAFFDLFIAIRFMSNSKLHQMASSI